MSRRNNVIKRDHIWEIFLNAKKKKKKIKYSKNKKIKKK